MYTDILFPTDGGPGTERAMERAFELARTFDATLHALYVLNREALLEIASDDERDELADTLDEFGRDITLAVQERAKEFDVDVVRQVRDGVPFQAILEYTDEHGVDLVVMGTRGRAEPGERHLGSTTQRVLQRTDVPVLTVGLDPTAPGTALETVDRVVIPTDGSDAAERAAEHALDIAERHGADVRVVYVLDVSTYEFGDTPRSIVGLLEQGGTNAVETVADEARDRAIPVSTAVLRGVPAEAILQYARGAEADLVAMGTRGQTGRDERVLGSTTARVVGQSSIPILAVR